VALGIPIDHPNARRFLCDGRRNARAGRALAMVIRRIRRSHGTLHRKSYRITEQRIRQHRA
jgi:hypothetical protein